MNYLLDTCILSKGRKTGVHSEKLRKWFDQRPGTHYFVSILSIGEIQAGISKLKSEERERRLVLGTWLTQELIPYFEHRILGIDMQTCLIWGEMCGEARKRGKPLPAIDALIAATAIQHRLVLVTENVQDFLETGAQWVNPLSSS